MMEEAAAEMVEVMGCPIMIAEDQGERLVGALVDAQETRDLAILAERLHPDAPVAPLLAEVAMTLHRQAGEIASLLDRLIAHTNHDQPHAHVELDADAIRELLQAMFRDPFEAEPRY